MCTQTIQEIIFGLEWSVVFVIISISQYFGTIRVRANRMKMAWREVMGVVAEAYGNSGN